VCARQSVKKERGEAREFGVWESRRRRRRENVTFKIKELLTQTIESMSWKNRKIEEKSKEEVKKE
jgi:hypothetical protein